MNLKLHVYLHNNSKNYPPLNINSKKPIRNNMESSKKPIYTVNTVKGKVTQKKEIFLDEIEDFFRSHPGLNYIEIETYRVGIGSKIFHLIQNFSPKIETIKMFGNFNKDFPLDLTNFYFLQRLEINASPMQEEFIKKLQRVEFPISLERIKLSNSLFQKIPENLFRLKNLRVLDLQDSPISHLPKNLLILSHLRELNLCGAAIKSISVDLIGHPQLKWIDRDMEIKYNIRIIRCFDPEYIVKKIRGNVIIPKFVLKIPVVKDTIRHIYSRISKENNDSSKIFREIVTFE